MVAADGAKLLADPEALGRLGQLLRHGITRFERDPLASFRYCCEGQRVFVRTATTGAETLVRCSNSGGKTTGGAAFGVALARGERTLDGEPLPDLPVPNIGWVLNQSYKQQTDSSQKAYKKWLGRWPYYVAFVVGKGKGYWEVAYVATWKCKHVYDGVPGRCQECSDCPTCSKIVFHCEGSASTIGGRIDWAHADEPPDESTWREMRSRRDGDNQFIKFITATPLEIERWMWLSEDFPPTTEIYRSPWMEGFGDRPGTAYEAKVTGRRAQVRWTIHDNKFLSDEAVASFLADWEGDPFYNARVRGDWVDTAGKCPFNVEVLQSKWLPRCRPGKKRSYVIQDEVDIVEPDGEGFRREVQQISVEAEEWYDPEEIERYICVLDPSAGIAPLANEPLSKRHDPAGLLIISRVNPRLIARYNGYLSPYGLGSLAAQIAKRYNDALVDVDMTGGYGNPCYTALHAAKHRRLFADISPDKPGQMRNAFGYRISAATKGRYIGAIQTAISEDSVVIKSREVVSCLLGMTIDQSGKLSTAKAKRGRFDEDASCLGRALALLEMVSRRPRTVKSLKQRFMGMAGIKYGPEVIRENW